MKKISLFLFFVMSFTQLVYPSFAMDDELPPAAKITGNKLHIHTELMGLLEEGRHLRQSIINKLKEDEIGEITIEGKISLLGNTLKDIAALNLKNLRTLNLMLFIQGDNEQKNKSFLQALFKQSNPNLTIQMSSIGPDGPFVLDSFKP